MDLHDALRTVRAHGLHVVMAGGQKARALAAGGAVAVPEYPGESEAMRQHRLWYRAKLEREARSPPAVRAAVAPAVAAGRSADDFAEFPPCPWTKNAELHVPRVVDRPLSVLREGDFAPIPEAVWPAPSRDRAASRSQPVQSGGEDYAPMPANPWGC
jgi:hypothetical protein